MPDYLGSTTQADRKFVRTPALGDIPYPVLMEPNLVVEFYAKN